MGVSCSVIRILIIMLMIFSSSFLSMQSVHAVHSNSLRHSHSLRRKPCIKPVTSRTFLLCLQPNVRAPPAVIAVGARPQGPPHPDVHLPTSGAPHEHHRVASDEQLVVDELAPAGGEQVPPESFAVDVAEVPNAAVQVGDDEKITRLHLTFVWL
ncbi:uncharacterized protein LOC133727988 [Rosa rugosa]|uniref:uncharacterized protein LOC133727988 n=1 Tax=Rosa rugosa TaxID=74645 RepID=UPI002B40C563|nr:uncharacterized protein LOC133727988 [Rosa rugosa]